MITAKLSLLVATAASVAHGAELTGYIMDKTCIYKFDCGPGFGPDNKCPAPDKTNPHYGPEEHTGWCLLLSGCEPSGFTILSEDPAAEDGKHKLIANFTDKSANQAISDYIRKVQPDASVTRNRALMPFPLVEVVYDDGSPSIDGIVQLSGSPIIKDPWPESAYDGSPTDQTACYEKSEATLEGNMCFRSDVMVSSADAKNMFVIESNGCPDHANMDGGGAVANSQEWPMAPEE